MTPERLAEIEAEAKNPKKFGWSNPEGTLLELAAHIRDLEAQAINADMGDAILDEIAGTLKELGCSHGPDAHLSTPPMFYREWMLCVMGSAIRSATRDLEAQVREARGLAEKAYKQAEMYFVREWRSSGALTAACEELQGQGYGGDVDDIEAEMLACIAPPIWPKRLIEIRDALAAATSPSPEVK